MVRRCAGEKNGEMDGSGSGVECDGWQRPAEAKDLYHRKVESAVLG